jgi:hypothetical protein
MSSEVEHAVGWDVLVAVGWEMPDTVGWEALSPVTVGEAPAEKAEADVDLAPT